MTTPAFEIKTKAKTLGKFKRNVTAITLKGTEKRYRPTKHYVYIFNVVWSDGNEYTIHRKYSQFYDFHLELLDFFPIEAGVIDSSERIIPYLPGRKFFTRSEIQKTADERKGTLEEYCQGLIKLSAKISQSDHVIKFFEAKGSDLFPPQDATKKPEKSNILTAIFGKERKKSLTPTDNDIAISAPLELEQHLAVADFKHKGRNQVSFIEGQIIEVVEKNESGWWFVQVDGKPGWAPASYLDPIEQSKEQEELEPVLTGERYLTTQAYDRKLEDEITFEKGVFVDVLHKLLDGWWIVSYDEQVGYAPSMFLKPYGHTNLTKDEDPSASPAAPFKKHFEPTPRRCTIKSKALVEKAQPARKRDLTVYRKASKKIRESRGQGHRRPPPLPPKENDPVEETEEDQFYVNEFIGETIQEDNEEDEENYEYVDNENDQPPIPKSSPTIAKLPLKAILSNSTVTDSEDGYEFVDDLELDEGDDYELMDDNDIESYEHVTEQEEPPGYLTVEENDSDPGSDYDDILSYENMSSPEVVNSLQRKGHLPVPLDLHADVPCPLPRVKRKQKKSIEEQKVNMTKEEKKDSQKRINVQKPVKPGIADKLLKFEMNENNVKKTAGPVKDQVQSSPNVKTTASPKPGLKKKPAITPKPAFPTKPKTVLNSNTKPTESVHKNFHNELAAKLTLFEKT